MTTRTSASLAALALLAAGAVALNLSPASPAAVAVPTQTGKPRIEKLTVKPLEILEGRLEISVTGENVDRYQIWAACPRAVSLKIGGADICDSRLNRDDDQLERQIAILENAAAATGTVVITVKVDQPETPAAPWTQKSASVRLTAGN
jgi:hypothetical protein